MSYCENIKDLLIKRSISPLSQSEEEKVVDHLNECAGCQAFKHHISTFDILGETSTGLKPRPEIKSTIVKRMRTRAQDQKLGVVDRIADVLSLRFSVYKLAAVAVILFLLVLSAPQFKQSGDITSNEYRTTVIDTVSLNVINLNQIIQIVDSQKVGVNLREDTVLAKILYTL